jgi:hypothetical protein
MRPTVITLAYATQHYALCIKTALDMIDEHYSTVADRRPTAGVGQESTKPHDLWTALECCARALLALGDHATCAGLVHLLRARDVRNSAWFACVLYMTARRWGVQMWLIGKVCNVGTKLHMFACVRCCSRMDAPYRKSKVNSRRYTVQLPAYRTVCPTPYASSLSNYTFSANPNCTRPQ